MEDFKEQPAQMQDKDTQEYARTFSFYGEARGFNQAPIRNADEAAAGRRPVGRSHPGNFYDDTNVMSS